VALGCLTTLAATIAGAVIGGMVGAATEPPPDPNAFLDLSGLRPAVFAFYGAIIDLLPASVDRLGRLFS
jgi:hypothetical protein